MGYAMNSDATYNHVVYWSIPQIGADGVIVGEQHYAVNLSEIAPADAKQIESMLRSHRAPFSGTSNDPKLMRTDPKITGYRDLFKPFVEVKKRMADGLCRFSCVWLPFVYAEYADPDAEPRHHRHPAAQTPLAGTG